MCCRQKYFPLHFDPSDSFSLIFITFLSCLALLQFISAWRDRHSLRFVYGFAPIHCLFSIQNGYSISALNGKPKISEPTTNGMKSSDETRIIGPQLPPKIKRLDPSHSSSSGKFCIPILCYICLRLTLVAMFQVECPGQISSDFKLSF